MKLSLVVFAPQLHAGQHTGTTILGLPGGFMEQFQQDKSTDTLFPAFTNTEQSLAGLPSQVQDNRRVMEICWLWQTMSFLWKVGLWGAAG